MLYVLKKMSEYWIHASRFYLKLQKIFPMVPANMKSDSKFHCKLIH